MIRGLIGKKIGMTGTYSQDGTYVPVTALQVGPCTVTQVKTVENDGYDSIQVGFGEKKDKHTTKALKGHFAKCGDVNFNTLREFEVSDVKEHELGQQINLDMFEIGELVEVTGVTKGRGFSGTIKRHGFARGPETHGCRNHRKPGSIGCSAWPAKVVRGKKMPGHYGVDRNTVRNLQIIDILPDDNVILVKGPVPGAKNGILEIKKPKY